MPDTLERPMTKKRVRPRDAEPRITHPLRITEEAYRLSYKAAALADMHHGDWVSELLIEIATKRINEFVDRESKKK